MYYGKRIRFRAPERTDIPTFVSWFNDPEVRHGLALYTPMSIAQEEKWFEEMLKRPEIQQPLTIEARSGEDWVTIGNTSLFSFNHQDHRAELGIVIGNKDYWNKGYGTEAITLLLKHCFETLNLNRVMLKVFKNNPRAIRCYEKSGFQHEGTMRQAHYQDGKYHDVLIMGILKEEWDLLNT
jgi:RimJ/RimL family protein N-acetyltransferase